MRGATLQVAGWYRHSRSSSIQEILWHVLRYSAGRTHLCPDPRTRNSEGKPRLPQLIERPRLHLAYDLLEATANRTEVLQALFPQEPALVRGIWVVAPTSISNSRGSVMVLFAVRVPYAKERLKGCDLTHNPPTSEDIGYWR